MDNRGFGMANFGRDTGSGLAPGLTLFHNLTECHGNGSSVSGRRRVSTPAFTSLGGGPCAPRAAAEVWPFSAAARAAIEYRPALQRGLTDAGTVRVASRRLKRSRSLFNRRYATDLSSQSVPGAEAPGSARSPRNAALDFQMFAPNWPNSRAPAGARRRHLVR